MTEITMKLERFVPDDEMQTYELSDRQLAILDEVREFMSTELWNLCTEWIIEAIDDERMRCREVLGE